MTKVILQEFRSHTAQIKFRWNGESKSYGISSAESEVINLLPNLKIHKIIRTE